MKKKKEIFRILKYSTTYDTPLAVIKHKLINVKTYMYMYYIYVIIIIIIKHYY